MPADKFRFNPAADAELTEAAVWYESQREGVGLELLQEVREKIAVILDAPERWPLVKGTRRVLLGKFPFAIVYREISADEVEIVAVAHFKRRPRYWARR